MVGRARRGTRYSGRTRRARRLAGLLALLAIGASRSAPARGGDWGAELPGPAAEVRIEVGQPAVAWTRLEAGSAHAYRTVDGTSPGGGAAVAPEARALAAADLDEDGMPDLVVGGARGTGGALLVYRGNESAVYPYSAESARRRAEGTFGTAPFHSPARAFELPEPADFVATGDFDNDGHQDVATAAWGGHTLGFLSGDGRGGLGASRALALPCAVTAAAAGEVNRRDGIADLVIACAEGGRARLLMLEGPDGVLAAEPEELPLPAPATALALGRVDGDALWDVAAAAGSELVVVRGRDRRLSLGPEQRRGVRPARVDRFSLPFGVRDLVAGDFLYEPAHEVEVALLGDDGGAYVLPRQRLAPDAPGSPGLLAVEDLERIAGGAGAGDAFLVAARTSALVTDDLWVVDRDRSELRVERTGPDPVAVAQRRASPGALVARPPLRLAATSAPAAILPMRLSPDPLTDLVVVSEGAPGPAVLLAEMPLGGGAHLVNRTTQQADVQPGDGLCDVDAVEPGLQCTLSAAVDEASRATESAVSISFENPGTYPFRPPTFSFFVVPVSIDGSSVGGPGSPTVEIYSTTTSLGLPFRGGSSVLRGVVMGFGNATFGVAGNNVVEGNWFGTDITGTSPSPFGTGLLGTQNAPTRIGGTSPAARNVISSNRVNAGSTGDVVQGNYIGTDKTGTAAIGNGFVGAALGVGSLGTIFDVTVGGTTAGAGNLVSGNHRDGVLVFDAEALVQGNKIGSDVSGTLPLGNQADGLEVGGAASMVTLGGTTPNASNLVVDNGDAADNGNGILLSGTTGVLVQGNFIGVTRDLVPMGNGFGGVNITGSANVVGGTSTFAGNFIGDAKRSDAPLGWGILISGGSAAANLVQGNFIGGSIDQTAFGNARNGVEIRDGAVDNIVGGDQEAQNVIALNGGAGVFVGTTGTTGNRILGNWIFDNGGLGIDLSPTFTPDGPTANDPGDGDGGGNRRQNHPILTNVLFGEGTTTIDGILSSQPGRDYRIELFWNEACDPSGFGEGDSLLGSFQVTTDGAGDAPFSFPASGIASNPTATATDILTGDTSEFSPCFPAEPREAVINSVGDASDQAPADGDCDTGDEILRDGVPEPECTLRAFLQHANALPGPDTGRFDVPADQYPPTGEPTFQPGSPFPPIQGPVILDGATQPGAGRVAVDYGLAGGALQGPTGGPCPAVPLGSALLEFATDQNVLRGFAFFCYDTAIRATGSKNGFTDLVIGTDFTSTPNLGGAVGIELLGGTMTEIARNVVVSNSIAGVYLGPGSDDASVHHNLIGTDGARQSGLGNTTGVLVDNSPKNVINANIVVASVAEGIRVAGAGSTQTLIQNNHVGTDDAWIQSLGNGIGVQFVDTLGGQIRYNFVASNTSHGIVLNGVENTDLVDNHVGTNPAGDDLGNGGDGVLLAGTAVSFSMNVLSGNDGNGLHIIATSADNIVVDNKIGVTPDGLAALGNGEHGVLLQGAHGTFLGGLGIDAEPTGNQISGNTLAGVRIEGGEDNQVLANEIGTGLLGLASIPNSEGISIDGALRTWVGLFADDEDPAPNLVAGNAHDGIVVGDGAMETRIENNWIGVHPGGFPVPNLDAGIRFVGTSTARTRTRFNTIGYNGDAGIDVGPGHASAELRGNRVGRNGDLGIDLEGDGVTFNDPGDGDDGANGRQNFPVVTDILVGTMGRATIRGTLDSSPNGSAYYRIEAFANEACDPSDFGEGEIPIAIGTATPGPFGYEFVLVGSLDPGELVTTTATLFFEIENGTFYGATSEFSECAAVPLPEPGILINEVDAVAGTDLEFVEVSSAGQGGQSLSDLVLVLYDGATDLVTAAFDLDGFMTDAEGCFVAGGAGVVDVDLVLPDGTLGDGADAVALYEGSAVTFPVGAPLTTAGLFDALVYGPQPDDLELLALLEPGQPQPDEAGAGDAAAHSLQRCPDSAGGERYSDLYAPGPPTPGAENDCVVCTLTPPFATLSPDLFHSIEAQVLDRRLLPLAGAEVDFEVLTGPNAGVASTETTDSHGEAALAYQGTGGEGVDLIRASGVSAGRPFRCDTTVSWFDASSIFSDGFESSDFGAWSNVIGAGGP